MPFDQLLHGQPLSSTSPEGAADSGAPPSSDVGSISLAIALAFVGGLILNLMPCVLPVVSIKILGFVHQAREDARRVRNHGLLYGVGVVASSGASTRR